MQLWYCLVNFAFINKELCLQNNQTKVLSDLKWMSWPNSTIFSLSVTDVAFGQPALSTIWNCSQNDLTYVHDQNIWLIESRSCRQKVMSFSIPMCIKTILVAIILCTMKPFQFYFLNLLRFLKGDTPVNIFI